MCIAFICVLPLYVYCPYMCISFMCIAYICVFMFLSVHFCVFVQIERQNSHDNFVKYILSQQIRYWFIKCHYKKLLKKIRQLTCYILVKKC